MSIKETGIPVNTIGMIETEIRECQEKLASYTDHENVFGRSKDLTERMIAIRKKLENYESLKNWWNE